MNLAQIEKKFKNKKLLKQALTHSSFSNKNNERLEFLGDRVLGLVVAELLYLKFPNESEGDLAKRFAGLVCTETLAEIAEEIEIITEIKVDRELRKKIKKQTHLHANTVEALIGALYLDQSYQFIFKFIKELWEKKLNNMITPPQDAKSKLQELSQKLKNLIPIYNLLEKKGKEHSPIFIIEAEALGIKTIGEGSTKKEAERNSAEKLLDLYKKI